MITGIAAVFGFDLSCRQMSVPGIPGSMRSSSTASGAFSRMRANASPESCAATGSNPACRSANSSTWTMSFSSSTMRMRGCTSRVISRICDRDVTSVQLSEPGAQRPERLLRAPERRGIRPQPRAQERRRLFLQRHEEADVEAVLEIRSGRPAEVRALVLAQFLEALGAAVVAVLGHPRGEVGVELARLPVAVKRHLHEVADQEVVEDLPLHRAHQRGARHLEGEAAAE